MKTLDILFFGILVACGLDYALSLIRGNAGTFSYRILGLEAGHPFFAVLVVYTLMTLSGHLCLPFVGTDSALRFYVGLVVGLLPILVAILYLKFHPKGNIHAAAQLKYMFAGGGWWLFRWLCVAAVAGLLNGKLAVRQHLN